jgi:SAM-dependent methyltransferase
MTKTIPTVIRSLPMDDRSCVQGNQPAVVYDALAPLYDRIMSHVEYDEWVRLIERVIDRFLETASPAILEIGGGTGILGQKLVDQGYSYTGSDRSFSMCSFASQRKVPFLCADGLHLPVKKQFDLTIFLYDGINYLQTLDDYAALMREVARNLVPGGFFLFDITTEANSLRHFRSYLEFEEWCDCAYVRRSYYRKEPMEQHNDFTIFRQVAGSPALYQKIHENHTQIVFGASSIEKMIPSSLFSIEGIWDGFSFKKFHSHSERIHFLLKKRGP